MTASEIIKSEGLQLIRERKVEHAKGEPWQYDVKEAFTGSKKGFVYLNAFTKNAMRTVYNAMKDEVIPSGGLLTKPERLATTT